MAIALGASFVVALRHPGRLAFQPAGDVVATDAAAATPD